MLFLSRRLSLCAVRLQRSALMEAKRRVPAPRRSRRPTRTDFPLCCWLDVVSFTSLAALRGSAPEERLDGGKATSSSASAQSAAHENGFSALLLAGCCFFHVACRSARFGSRGAP